MASKRRKRRRVCTRKIKYDKDTAFRIALVMRNQQQYDGRVVDAYKCLICGQWHVGHRPKRVQQSITARRKSRG